MKDDIVAYLKENNATADDAIWLADWIKWQATKWGRHIPKVTAFQDMLGFNSAGRRIPRED